MRLVQLVAIAVVLLLATPRSHASSCARSCAQHGKACLQTARRAGKSLKSSCGGTGKVRKACRQAVDTAVKRQTLTCRASKAICLDCCERDDVACGSWCGDGAVDAAAGEQCDPPVQATCRSGGACQIDCRCPTPVIPPGTCGDGVVDAGEQCDLGPANGSAGDCCTADCRFADASVVCRPAAGACDVAESCTGGDAACPADAKAASGTSCGDDGNPCTVDECDGVAAVCPHAAGHAGTVCRTSRGECDEVERCDGTSPLCPLDARKPNGVGCADDGSPCTSDACDGLTDVCQHRSNGSCHCGNGTLEPALGEECDRGTENGAVGSCCSNTCTFVGAGLPCRPAAGACDVAETCSGSSAACPADAWQPSGTVCRPSAGECDVAESCSGAGPACPADTKLPAGTGCSDDANPCTVDQCDGVSALCPHAPGNTGTVCRAARGECDLAETCSGVTAACPPDLRKGDGTACADDGSTCTNDACDGQTDVCQHPSNGSCICGNGQIDEGEACDQGAANGSAESCCTNTCRYRGAGEACRPAAGDCDVAESCSGASAACPADGWKPSGTVCRSAAGSCDVAESCSGSGPACPADATAPSGTVCRAAAGDCDVAETCDGSSAACPADGWLASGTVCRAAGGACDVAELCPGTGPTCPVDAKLGSGVVCRAAAGACDVAETCNGTSAACPADVSLPSGTVCRPSAGECDVAEACSGASPSCPPDAKVSAGTGCLDDANPCTVDQCDGVAATCPHAPGNAGAVCRSARGECDLAETCSGLAPACPPDVRKQAGTGCTDDGSTCTNDTCDGQTDVCQHPTNNTCVCGNGAIDSGETCDQGSANGTTGSCCTGTCTLRGVGQECRPAAGPCDVAEVCSGAGPACPADAKLPSGTVCRSAAGVCDVAETCTGSSAACPADGWLGSGTVCRSAAGVCDVAETCSGAGPACPADAKLPSGTVCRSAAGVCDVAESCTGSSAACPANGWLASGTVCRSAAGVCDVAETCSGAGPACPADAKLPSGTVCRSAAGACDVAESCTGSSAACPADTKLPSGTVCRVGSGDVCDPPELCSGVSAACPSDLVTPGGTQCRPAGACPPAESCTGVPGAKCPTDVCAPTEELLGCFALETGPGQRADLPDVWNVAVQAGVQVTLTADTVDAATAADLCFRIQCPGQALLSGDDEVACSFAPPSKACPQKTFVPASTATCQVTVGVCSGACADEGRARYALRVAGGVPTLASDDGVPVARASGTLPCGTLGDRYTFQTSPGQEIVVRTDTVDAASAASLCVAGSCTSGERFDEYDTADCSAGGATYRCVEKHFVPSGSALCKVQVTACHAECAGAQASYLLEVAGTTALTAAGDDVALGTCNNGVAEALEVCGEPGLPTCPTGWTCADCACQRTMPSLATLRADVARSTLAGAGIRVGAVLPLVKDAFPPAQVLGQSIAANAVVRSGDAVDLTMSLPNDTGEFLTHLGTVIESEASAAAYYDTIDPCDQRTTLAAWLAANGFGTSGSEASAIYENHNDLGFGRRMHVRRNASDSVAYYVQNFRTVDDAWLHPERILATVAMEYSRPINPATCAPNLAQAPFVKFFTYGANGARISKVDLDGRGDKYQPEMCTVCHGGFPGTPSNGVYPNAGNVGARFIPFDLDSFEYSKLNPLLSRTNQLGAFKELNRAAITHASSAEPFPSTNSTSCAAHTLVCGWYGDCNGASPCSCDLACGLPNAFDGGFVPSEWAGLATTYTNVLKPGCRGCHAQLFPDFAAGTDFSSYGSVIQPYVCEQGRMPIAARTFQNFWLGRPGLPYAPQGLADFFGSGECASSGPTGQQQLVLGTSVQGPLPSDPALGIGGPRAIAIDDDRTLYVSGFTSSKVLKYVPSTGAATVIVDTTGGGVAPLVNASGIAVDHDRNVFVAGFTSDDVLRVSPQGAVTKVLDSTGDGVHPFDGPQGDCVGVDDAGNLYVAGTLSHNVFKRTPAGQITQIVGATGDGAHALTSPFSLAVAGDGTTYVTGAASNNVFRIDPDGAVSQIIDQTGDGQGQVLTAPVAIAVGRQGSVVVAAQGSKNAFRIWPDGRIEVILVSITDSSKGLGVTLDEAENAYVSIRAEGNIYQLTPGGSFTHVFNPMDADGATGPTGPYDMVVDPRTRVVWVALRERTGVASIDFGH